MSNRYRAAFKNTLKTICSSKKCGFNRSSLYYYTSNNTKVTRVDKDNSMKKSGICSKNALS